MDRTIPPHLPALLLYGVLTLAFTWPLALRLGDVVPHDLGDPLLSTWTLWWNAHVMPFTARWWDGMAFYPARDTLTFSDHRVGIGVIATPVIWLGASPLIAHNLSFLLSFFFSALAAYALCLVVTRNREAALVGGLIFGFNPYRADHLAHLELLSSYWLPIVLLALHQWSATTRSRWLGLLVLSLVMQALTSGYYFMFSGVLVALWLVWFTPRHLATKQYVGLALALVTPLLLIAPILLEYRQAHRAMGLSRSIMEIEHYSANLIGLVTAPRLLALWDSPEAWYRPEGALLPGMMAMALVVARLLTRRPAGQAACETPPQVDRLGDAESAPPLSLWARRLRHAALAGAATMAAVAALPGLFGPIAYEVAGQRISVSDPYKPLSIATLLFGAWFLTSAHVRAAWRRSSAFAFYTLATIAMWLFALGPTARLLDHRILYKAPYSWLMLLPGFSDGFRVPARFAMLAALTLSVAAALAFCRLVYGRSAKLRIAVACTVCLAVIADSWIEPLPLVPAPRALTIPNGVPPDAVVMELPVGLSEDAIAMYRSMDHGRRTINGLSGYDAPHYAALRAALSENRTEALRAIAAYAPVAVFAARDPRGDDLSASLRERTAAQRIAETDTHVVWVVPQAPAADLNSRPRPIEAGTPGPTSGVPAAEMRLVRELTSASNPQELGWMADGNRATAWMPTESQRGSEQFTADLGGIVEVTGIVLAQGGSINEFPRAIGVDVSADGTDWSEVWQGDMATRVVAAAIQDPRDIGVLLPFENRQARFVRVRQLGQSNWPWAVAEFRVMRARAND